MARTWFKGTGFHPGGPSGMSGSGGMTTVHAHLRLGRPVRQHERKLGATASGLLNYYRKQKAINRSQMFTPVNAIKEARWATKQKAVHLASTYGTLFFHGVGRNPDLFKAAHVLNWSPRSLSSFASKTYTQRFGRAGTITVNRLRKVVRRRRS